MELIFKGVALDRLSIPQLVAPHTCMYIWTALTRLNELLRENERDGGYEGGKRHEGDLKRVGEA